MPNLLICKKKTFATNEIDNVIDDTNIRLFVQLSIHFSEIDDTVKLNLCSSRMFIRRVVLPITQQQLSNYKF